MFTWYSINFTTARTRSPLDNVRRKPFTSKSFRGIITKGWLVGSVYPIKPLKDPRSLFKRFWSDFNEAIILTMDKIGQDCGPSSNFECHRCYGIHAIWGSVERREKMIRNVIACRSFDTWYHIQHTWTFITNNLFIIDFTHHVLTQCSSSLSSISHHF